MNWTKQYPGWTMFGAMVGLLIFLWGLAIPLSLAPEPIGPAANEFAAGARITVLLTLISGYMVPKLAREIGGEPSKTPLDLQLRQQ